MRSDLNTITNIKKWLTDHGKTQAWLASEMDIAPSLISQLFNGSRKLQPAHIEMFSQITGMTISELASSEDAANDTLVYSLRGAISTKEGERSLVQLLLDAEHFVQLINK